MKRPNVVALVAVVASGAVLIAGCAGASNAGGNTQCKDFLAMSAADQGAVVARMLKERNGRNSSTGDVVTARSAVAVACAPAEKQGTSIENAAR